MSDMNIEEDRKSSTLGAIKFELEQRRTPAAVAAAKEEARRAGNGALWRRLPKHMLARVTTDAVHEVMPESVVMVMQYHPEHEHLLCVQVRDESELWRPMSGEQYWFHHENLEMVEDAEIGLRPTDSSDD